MSWKVCLTCRRKAKTCTAEAFQSLPCRPGRFRQTKSMQSCVRSSSLHCRGDRDSNSRHIMNDDDLAPRDSRRERFMGKCSSANATNLWSSPALPHHYYSLPSAFFFSSSSFVFFFLLKLNFWQMFFSVTMAAFQRGRLSLDASVCVRVSGWALWRMRTSSWCMKSRTAGSPSAPPLFFPRHEA